MKDAKRMLGVNARIGSAPVLRLGTGEPVTDRIDSHLPSDFKALLPEILSKVHSDHLRRVSDGSFEVVLDLGRVVGDRICVETRPDDDIVYAQRPGRSGLTRFARNRSPQACSTVVLVLRPSTKRGGYFVVTGWFGILSRPEPWDRNARPDSAAFWLAHALVWGSTPVVPGTETTECPHCHAPRSVSRRWPVCISPTR